MSTNPFRALRDYKDLPPAFGWHQLIAAALARAPYAMLPLGLMTAFTASTQDIAVGGMVTALFSIAVAACSPLIGRSADVWGQRRVLLTLIPLNATAILGLFWAASSGLNGPLLYLLAVVAGATNSPIGSFTRARWVGMQPTPRVLTAAFSYESMMDEVVFVLGPALVGIAATAAAPSAPLLLSFALLVLAGIPFALRAPKSTPTAVKAAEGRIHPPIYKVISAVLPAIIALIAIGTFFGSSQAGVTERAEELGIPNAAGLTYAAMGISSAAMALLVVVLPTAFTLAWRFITFSLALGGATVAASFAHSLPATAFWLFMAGFFVGPTLVTAFTLAEQRAPEGGIAVAMTLMSSSVTIGVSLGAGVGGNLANAGGSHPTFMFAAASTVLVTLIGIWTLLRAGRNKVPSTD